MTDTPQAATIRIELGPETIAVLHRLADALAAFGAGSVQPPSPALSSAPARPVAPGDSAPSPVGHTRSPEGPSRAGDPTAGRAVTRAPRLLVRDWLTPEREKIIRDLWPTDTPVGDILARVAVLPGGQVPVQHNFHQAVVGIGLRRPASHWNANLTKARNHVNNRGPSPNVAPAAPPPDAAPPTPAPVPPTPAPDAAFTPSASGAPPPPDRPVAARSFLTPGTALPPVTEKVVASKQAIRDWAEARGVRMEAFDLAAVNARAKQLGHPGFLVKTTGFG